MSGLWLLIGAVVVNVTGWIPRDELDDDEIGAQLALRNLERRRAEKRRKKRILINARIRRELVVAYWGTPERFLKARKLHILDAHPI